MSQASDPLGKLWWGFQHPAQEARRVGAIASAGLESSWTFFPAALSMAISLALVENLGAL